LLLLSLTLLLPFVLSLFSSSSTVFVSDFFLQHVSDFTNPHSSHFLSLLLKRRENRWIVYYHFDPQNKKAIDGAFEHQFFGFVFGFVLAPLELIDKDTVPALYLDLVALKAEAEKEKATGKDDTALTHWDSMVGLIPQLSEFLQHKLAKNQVRAAGERAGIDVNALVFVFSLFVWF
jgi:hypothetical protein